MRNVLLIASLLLTSTVSFGAVSGQQKQSSSLSSDSQREYLRMDISSVDAPMRAADNDEGPYNDPQGEEKLYIRNCNAIAPVFWFMIDTPVNGAFGSVVFAEDNVVYLSPVVNNILGLGYVKGIKDENNVITFQFPQYMGSLKDGRRLDMYCMKRLGNDEDGWCLGAEIIENQTYKMQIAEDGTITPLPEYEETVIGWSPDGVEFAGYGDYGYSFVPQTDETVTPPDTAIEKDCTWGNGSVGYFGKMAFDGDDLYIRGMYPIMPDSWVKCTKSADGSYRFESGQLLGIRDPKTSQKYWCYGYASELEPNQDPDSDGPLRYILLDGMDLIPQDADSYKSNANVYPSTKTTVGTTISTFDKASGECVLSPREEVEMLLTPKAPEIQAYRIFGDGYFAKSYAYFNQPQYSVDDILINPDNLYYEVYADGELFTFTQEQFPDIPEESWTLIPYTFSTSNESILNSYIWWSDIHQLTISGFIRQIGIRSVCKVGEEVRYSDMAVASPEGVEGVEVDSEVVSETLTNLAGVRVSNPGPGVYIRTTRHADGTVRSTKVLY